MLLDHPDMPVLFLAQLFGERFHHIHLGMIPHFGIEVVGGAFLFQGRFQNFRGCS